MTVATEVTGEIGLRERKKARTRVAIQHEALHLFREQGYDRTTVEQIAAAADISPSTFFRYFPTKEDVVLADEYDPFAIAAVRNQPPDVRPIEAIRRAMRATFDELPRGDLEDFDERVRLIFLVPELRAAASDQLFMQSIDEVAELLAERLGLGLDDPAVRTLAGSLLGVALSSMYRWAADPSDDLIDVLDEALKHLDAAYPL